MKLRRDIVSVPVRTGDETWSTVIGLIAMAGSDHVEQLESASSVLGALLSEEHYSSRPLTLAGEGQRLVIYFVYGLDAVAADTDVEPLGWNPTAGDWHLYVPCAPEHLNWATKLLSARATRIVVHELDDDLTARRGVGQPEFLDQVGPRKQSCVDRVSMVCGGNE